jgi:hypothetical protein
VDAKGSKPGEVDDEGLWTAANDDPGDGLGRGVKFLVGKVGGNKNEVTGTHGFGAFAVAAPADLPTAAKHVNDGFLLTVVHGTGGMCLGNHYAATDMGGTGKIAIDGGEAQNAGGLRRVAVEMIVAGNTNVGHHLAPKIGCQGVRGRCTLLGSYHRGKQKRPFVKAFAGKPKQPDFSSALQNP